MGICEACDRPATNVVQHDGLPWETCDEHAEVVWLLHDISESSDLGDVAYFLVKSGETVRTRVQELEPVMRPRSWALIITVRGIDYIIRDAMSEDEALDWLDDLRFRLEVPA